MKRTFFHHWLWTLLRVGAGIGILAWLIGSLPYVELKEAASVGMNRWPWWIAALISTGLGLSAGATRWHGLLKANGFSIPVLRVFRIFFTGQFFNAFFPGGCGGDLVRAYYAAREIPDKQTEAVFTVVTDRFIGLLVFMLVGAVLVAMKADDYLRMDRTRIPFMLIMIFLAGTATLFILLFRRHVFEKKGFLHSLTETTRFGPTLRRLYDSLFFYRQHPGVLTRSAFFSLLNLLFLTGACLCFGKSLNIQTPALNYFILFPVITVFTAIPLTPGGIGVRESLFVNLFAGIGVAAYLSVPLSLLVYIGGVFWSLAGGVIFVLTSLMQGRDIRKEVQNIQEESEQLSQVLHAQDENHSNKQRK